MKVTWLYDFYLRGFVVVLPHPAAGEGHAAGMHAGAGPAATQNGALRRRFALQ